MDGLLLLLLVELAPTAAAATRFFFGCFLLLTVKLTFLSLHLAANKFFFCWLFCFLLNALGGTTWSFVELFPIKPWLIRNSLHFPLFARSAVTSLMAHFAQPSNDFCQLLEFPGTWPEFRLQSR